MFTIKNTIFALTLSSALGCALMAGVFFAFSTFVMKGLDQIPANESISAFNSISVMVGRTLFGAAFVVTPLICVITIIFALWKWQTPASIYILAGGIIYIVFSLLVTIGFNIPLNDALAAVAPNDPNNANLWRNFYDPWMFWNHVRTIGSLGAATAFIIALCYWVKDLN
jgi:uncharacterized membrane protein